MRGQRDGVRRADPVNRGGVLRLAGLEDIVSVLVDPEADRVGTGLGAGVGRRVAPGAAADGDDTVGVGAVGALVGVRAGDDLVVQRLTGGEGRRTGDGA